MVICISAGFSYSVLMWPRFAVQVPGEEGGGEPLLHLVIDGNLPIDIKLTLKTLPRSLVKREEESPCSTSLLMAMASSRLLHFNTYTIGANVSLNKKKEIG
jgi:hypothetical protein